MAEPTISEKYQPLSLLALVGFGLAAFYALVVLVGGAVALLSRTPWLMPYWTFLLPLAVLVICLAARMHILNSEGALSGLGFTLWGSRLVILFGLTYAAYYIATFLAVRGPAINKANEFFNELKAGRLEQVFMMSQDISTKGMDRSALRDMLESRFNQPMPTQGWVGPFSRFRQERFVRFIEMAGEKANIVPIGVASWEYTTKGDYRGYRVLLIYHVATTLAEFDMKVETFGRDPKPGDSKGRQWQVQLVRSETAVMDPLKLTQEGEEFLKKWQKAQDFIAEWTAKINEVDGLTPAEREAYIKLIRLDDKTFWAGKQQRDDILRRIRNTFQPSAKGKFPPFNLTYHQAALPLMRESDGRTTMWIDVVLRYFEEGSMVPQYIVNGRLGVSAPTSRAADSSSAWQVDALEFESGRTAPEKRRQQQMSVPLIPE